MQEKYSTRSVKYDSKIRIRWIVVSGFIAFIVLLIIWLLVPNDFDDRAFSPVIALLVGAPVGLVIWYFRDQNKLSELERHHHDVTLKEFQKLQKWATGNIESGFDSNGKQLKHAETLQVSALHSLRPYLRGEFGENFKRSAYEIFISVLKTEHRKIFEKLELERRPLIYENIQSAINEVSLVKQVNQIASEEWFSLLINHDYSTKGISLVGVDLSQKYLIKFSGEGIDLSASKLQGANLSYSFIQKANLWDANLQGAKLRKTRMQQSDLRLTNFISTDLTLTYFQGSRFYRNDFTGANLVGANFTACYLYSVDFLGAHLVGAKFIGAAFMNCDFIGCNLSGSDFSGVGSFQLKFSGCCLGGSKFFCDVSDISFNGVNSDNNIMPCDNPVQYLKSNVNTKSDLSFLTNISDNLNYEGAINDFNKYVIDKDNAGDVRLLNVLKKPAGEAKSGEYTEAKMLKWIEHIKKYEYVYNYFEEFTIQDDHL